MADGGVTAATSTSTLALETARSITEFAQALVRIPSQAGIDLPNRIIEETLAFGEKHGIAFSQILDDKGAPVALVAEIKGAHPGKTWALNATLDTAPVCDLSRWHTAPFSGELRDGKLYGRGAADSKIAVAIFSHLAAELAQSRADMHGNLLLIFDADEHTGGFAGIKAALDAGHKPDGVMIGYPGNDKLVIGSRGFSRYEIIGTGKPTHSGATIPAFDNAVVRLAALVGTLSAQQPESPNEDFPRPPKLTVTGFDGGDSYSVVPGKATIRVDMRLTPAFDEAAADAYIRKLVEAHDVLMPPTQATEIRKTGSEPAFYTDDESELRRAFRAAIHGVTGKPVPEQVSGPSNIGNFLAKTGMEVTAGYGVPSRNVHAPNECADLRALPSVYGVYRATLKSLLKLG